MKKIRFAKKIQLLSPSPTLAIEVKVKMLIKEGKQIINLGIGEPDFDTPVSIQKAAIKAMRDGFTHYTETAGIVLLRKAIARKLLIDNHIAYDPSEIIVGVGSKHILYEALQVLCDTNDEVLISLPVWSTYVEQVKLANGKPVFIKLDPPYKLTASDVKKHITTKTKILIINSPANPTGAMIEKQELKKIADLAVEHGIWIIADEIYEKILYGTRHCSIASFNGKIKQKTITINGVSKAYAMTGWRIGYAAGPKEVIAKMTVLQGQMTSNATSIAQIAAVAAFTGDQDPVLKMTKEFAKRRELVMQNLAKIPGLSFVPPEGAFYVFVSIDKLLTKKYPTSSLWCEGLLEKEHVAVVASEAFLYPKHFRLSFAASHETLRKGIAGIGSFIKSL